MISADEAETVVKALTDAIASGAITIDADRGHFNSEILEEVKQDIFDPVNYQVNFPGANEKLIASLGKQQDRWTTLFFSLGLSRECYKCGEYTSWEFNGKIIRLVTKKFPKKGGIVVDTDPCVFANGLPPITAKISVPSGQLVLGNDLRHIFDEQLIWKGNKNEKWSRANSINHYAGKTKYVERYANHGMLTGYLGSGGVDVYHNSTGIVITQSEERPKSFKKDGLKFSYAGHISLGLWWYGAADYENCLAVNEKETIKTLEKSKKSFYVDTHQLALLKVKPGTYEMTHEAWPDDDIKILSQIKLVR